MSATKVEMYTNEGRYFYYYVANDEAARTLAQRLLNMDYVNDVVTFEKDELNTRGTVVRASSIEIVTW